MLAILHEGMGGDGDGDNDRFDVYIDQPVPICASESESLEGRMR